MQPGALKYSDLTERVIGIFYDVYNELGYGFLESTYSAAMVFAFEECGLEVARQVPIPVWFRGRRIGPYFGDLVVERRLLLELKAARSIEPVHEAQ
jgi:GxxExxY protein